MRIVLAATLLLAGGLALPTAYAAAPAKCGLITDATGDSLVPDGALDLTGADLAVDPKHGVLNVSVGLADAHLPARTGVWQTTWLVSFGRPGHAERYGVELGFSNQLYYGSYATAYATSPATAEAQARFTNSSLLIGTIDATGRHWGGVAMPAEAFVITPDAKELHASVPLSAISKYTGLVLRKGDALTELRVEASTNQHYFTDPYVVLNGNAGMYFGEEPPVDTATGGTYVVGAPTCIDTTPPVVTLTTPKKSFRVRTSSKIAMRGVVTDDRPGSTLAFVELFDTYAPQWAVGPDQAKAAGNRTTFCRSFTAPGYERPYFLLALARDRWGNVATRSLLGSVQKNGPTATGC
jgi:hypothetical protein